MCILWKGWSFRISLFKKLVVLSSEMKKHNLNISLSSPNNDTGNAKSLSTRADSSSYEPEPEWIFDYGATHHMAVHKNMFSSINSCKTEHIFVGNSSPLAVKGKVSVEMKDNMVHNVLYVPKLSTNLLSIYQITNYGAGKIAPLTPDSVIIHEIEDPSQIVAIGKVDHHAHLYSFSHFELTSPTNVLLSHSNELSRLWHE